MAIPIAKSMGLNVITNGSAQNQERVMRLGADRFIDYKSEDYSKALYDVDYVLDTLGVREPEKEFSILKSGGSLVSLRGLPNGEFAARMGMPTMKRFLFGLAGNKLIEWRQRTNRNITSSSSVRTVPDSKESRRYSGIEKLRLLWIRYLNYPK